MNLTIEQLNQGIQDLFDPKNPLNIEIKSAYPELTPRELNQVIQWLNIQALNLFFANIIKDFDEKQKQKYQEFLESNPSFPEASMILLYGYYLKYGETPIPQLKALRTKLNQSLISRRNTLELIAKTVAKAEETEVDEIAENIVNGYYLNAIAKLKKLFK